VTGRRFPVPVERDSAAGADLPSAPAVAHRVIDAVWRLESARIVGGLVRLVGDLGVAEELSQDALVAALEQWPTEGIPINPGGWLMSTAKHRAIDRLRRSQTLQRKVEQLSSEARLIQEAAMFGDDEFAGVLDRGGVDDDVLRLVFIACHPVLPPEARTALTLRLIAGLTTAEIARAFLTSESTIAQRIVRAKQTLTAARVPFDVPASDQRPARLASVLEVLYLIFNEGYTATTGDDWMRPDLAAEALRLGRMLAELADREAEVHGPGSADGNPCIPATRPARCSRRPDPAPGTELRTMGPTPHCPRIHRPATRATPRTPTRALRPPGRHRGLPRPRAHLRGHRLAQHRYPLRRTAQRHPDPSDRAQPRRGRRHVRRARSRPADR
jgi:RNA polymerase sigma factor (sigma-70 family)